MMRDVEELSEFDEVEDGEPRVPCKRAAWTDAEEKCLRGLVTRRPGRRMDWQQVAAELGTGRSAKQCREHYLYSLQPNMIKGQWTQEEEYIIAREHSISGSQWSRIASCLPGRTDNAVKNTLYAATRSKARNKSYSILWLYAKQLQAGKTPAAALSKAVEVWKGRATAGVVVDVRSCQLSQPTRSVCPSHSTSPAEQLKAAAKSRKRSRSRSDICGGSDSIGPGPGPRRSPIQCQVAGRSAHSSLRSDLHPNTALHDLPGQLDQVSGSIALPFVDPAGIQAVASLGLPSCPSASHSQGPFEGRAAAAAAAVGDTQGGALRGGPAAVPPMCAPSAALVLDLRLPNSSACSSCMGGLGTFSCLGSSTSLPQPARQPASQPGAGRLAQPEVAAGAHIPDGPREPLLSPASGLESPLGHLQHVPGQGSTLFTQPSHAGLLAPGLQGSVLLESPAGPRGGAPLLHLSFHSRQELPLQQAPLAQLPLELAPELLQSRQQQQQQQLFEDLQQQLKVLQKQHQHNQPQQGQQQQNQRLGKQQPNYQQQQEAKRRLEVTPPPRDGPTAQPCPASGAVTVAARLAIASPHAVPHGPHPTTNSPTGSNVGGTPLANGIYSAGARLKVGCPSHPDSSTPAPPAQSLNPPRLQSFHTAWPSLSNSAPMPPAPPAAARAEAPSLAAGRAHHVSSSGAAVTQQPPAMHFLLPHSWDAATQQAVAKAQAREAPREAPGIDPDPPSHSDISSGTSFKAGMKVGPDPGPFSRFTGQQQQPGQRQLGQQQQVGQSQLGQQQVGQSQQPASLSMRPCPPLPLKAPQLQPDVCMNPAPHQWLRPPMQCQLVREKQAGQGQQQVAPHGQQQELQHQVQELLTTAKKGVSVGRGLTLADVLLQLGARQLLAAQRGSKAEARPLTTCTHTAVGSTSCGQAARGATPIRLKSTSNSWSGAGCSMQPGTGAGVQPMKQGQRCQQRQAAWLHQPAVQVQSHQQSQQRSWQQQRHGPHHCMQAGSQESSGCPTRLCGSSEGAVVPLQSHGWQAGGVQGAHTQANPL